jgi:predicted component of type VI protein secretion system
MKKNMWLMAAMILVLVAGCSPTDQAKLSTPTDGLQITDMKVSVSAEAGNVNTQVVSYEATIHNASSGVITLKSLEPVFESSVSPRVLDKNPQVVVDKTIAPDEGLVVNGSFKLDTSGLAKSDMKNWHYIDLIKLASEETIPVPTGGSKS